MRVVSCQAGDGLTKAADRTAFLAKSREAAAEAARTSPTRQTPLTKQVVSTSDS